MTALKKRKRSDKSSGAEFYRKEKRSGTFSADWKFFSWQSRKTKPHPSDQLGKHLITFKQGSVEGRMKRWAMVLYQLAPYHGSVDTIRLLTDRLIFLLYCLKKPVDERKQPHSLSEDLNILLGDLLYIPKLDLFPTIQYPSLILDQSVMKFVEPYMSFQSIIHMKCDCLGVASDLRESLKSLDYRLQYHFTCQRWLEKFFEDNYFTFLETFSEQEELVMGLAKIGYTKEKSEYIFSLIPNDVCQLHSPYFWALRYLGSSFYHDTLLLYVPKFPFQSDKINEWFVQYIDYDEDNDISFNLVKMINLSSVEAEKEKVIPLLDSEDFIFLYHGTTYQSCLNLIRNGIDLYDGSAKQDFSNRDGFYLSEDLEDAKRWGSAGRGDSYAVLVYKVRRDFMDAEKQHGLNLMEFDEWSKVVKHFRSGCKFELDPSLNLENFSFIRGPTAAGQAFLDGQLGRDFAMGDSIQICIKDKMFAKQFEVIGNVFCALFY